MTSMYDWTKTAMPGTSYGQPIPTDPLTGQQDFMSMMFPMTGNMSTPAMSSVAPATSTWDGIKNWMGDSGFLGSKLADGTQMQGWGMPALSAISGLTSAYFGMQQLGVAKDTLEQNKRQFQLNFDAQKKTTNAQLEDRQRARISSNPGAYQSVGEYMNKYGI